MVQQKQQLKVVKVVVQVVIQHEYDTKRIRYQYEI